MSVVSKNPFDLLGDDGDESPAPAPAPAAAAPAAQQPKVVPGAAPKGGRGARPARAPREAPVQDDAPGFDGERVAPPKRSHQGPDSHTKGPRDQRPPRTTGSRGRGGHSGPKVPNQGGERRQYERRGAPVDSQKKVEQGWGADEGKAELSAEVQGETDAQVEENTQTPAEGAATPAAAEETAAEPEEPEEVTKTYDQYLAEQAEKALGLIGKKEGRTVSSETLEGKAFVREALDEFYSGKQKVAATKEKAAKKEKIFIEVDGQFATPPGQGGRPPRPERGDRAPSGRGGPRGGGRGGRGGARGAAPTGARNGPSTRAPRQANIDANDEKAFPALGA